MPAAFCGKEFYEKHKSYCGPLRQRASDHKGDGRIGRTDTGTCQRRYRKHQRGNSGCPCDARAD